MKEQGTGIGWLLAGFFLGGFFSGIFINVIPGLSDPARVVICVIGPMLGIAFSYIFALADKNNQRREYEEKLRKQRAAEPPKAPTQIVGQSCVHCSSKIIFVNDGLFCPKCFAPNCVQCYGGGTVCKQCGTVAQATG